MKELSIKNIFITGGSGKIGSAVIQRISDNFRKAS
jgi:nucleoside-diphosphate-sugar epimerase